MANKTRNSLAKLFWGRRKFYWLFVFVLMLLIFLFKPVAIEIGDFIIDNSVVQPYSTAVVLAGDWEERLLELYDRYKSGEITEFLFTSEEKTEARLRLERLSGALPTRVERSVDVLRKAGVSNENITIIPGYVSSTRDEAIYIGNNMRENSIKGIAVITSKYHSRRACWVMRKMNPDLKFSCIASKYDKYDPKVWWRDRRSIMKVVTEYVKWTGYQLEFIMNRKLAQ
jgi:uncharacterized SAM-binding protein YcdF (DUF218 family)